MKISSLTRNTAEYLANHIISGFAVGDLVHVNRLPKSFEGGWCYATYPETMLPYVGGIFKIRLDHKMYGFELVSISYPEVDDKILRLLPYFVLDKVVKPATATKTITNNKNGDSSCSHLTHVATNLYSTKITKPTKSNKMTPFIFHSSRTISKRAYTLAGVLDETQTIATLRIGLSVCSDNDILNKKIGSDAAIGRAHKVPLFIIQLTAAEQSKSLKKFLEFANTFTPTFALHTKIKLEVKL